MLRLFLYFPLFYIGYLFHAGLPNSVFIGFGTAPLSTFLATTAATGTGSKRTRGSRG